MMAILLLTLALILTGCSTRPAPPEKTAADAAPPAKTASEPDTRPIIVAFGNSLSAGFGVDPGLSYPDFLQKDLDRAGYAYRVINAGVSGDTTTDGLARLPSVLAYHPAIVILEFGGNDGLRGLPVSNTRQNLEKMIVGLNKAGARVVLAGMTLPPNYGPEYIRSFEAIYPALARKYDLALIPFLLAGVGGTSYMQPDGLHPTAEGNRIVARNVLQGLEPLLSMPSGVSAEPKSGLETSNPGRER